MDRENLKHNFQTLRTHLRGKTERLFCYEYIYILDDSVCCEHCFKNRSNLPTIIESRSIIVESEANFESFTQCDLCNRVIVYDYCDDDYVLEQLKDALEHNYKYSDVYDYKKVWDDSHHIFSTYADNFGTYSNDDLNILYERIKKDLKEFIKD